MQRVTAEWDPFRAPLSSPGQDATRRDGTAGSQRSEWPIGGQVGLRAWSCCCVRSRSVGSTVDGQYINCSLSLSADRRRRRILPSLSAHASPLHWWPVCLLCSPITATEMERQRQGSPPSRIRIVHGSCLLASSTTSSTRRHGMAMACISPTPTPTPTPLTCCVCQSYGGTYGTVTRPNDRFICQLDRCESRVK